MLVHDLIQEIQPDTREIVQQAVRRYSQAVRDTIRDDLLRFKLEWSSPGDRGSFTGSCSVEVDEIGVPEEVSELRIAPEYELAALLAPWIPQLTGLRHSARSVGEMIGSLRGRLTGVIDVYGAEVAAATSADVATRLMQFASIAGFDLVRMVLAVDKDVLGRYTYSTGDGRSGYDRTCTSSISLYWGVIGLCAQSLGITTEALAVVVLAHEFGHAYTHLGFDRDGTRWSGRDFAATEHSLKESLAQYYTALVARRLDAKVPGLFHAYETLVPKQPPAYQAHIPWLVGASPEVVAGALAMARRRGPVRYDEFTRDLRSLGAKLP